MKPLVAGLLALASGGVLLADGPPMAGTTNASSQQLAIAPMDPERFWQIVERTTPLEANTDAQAAALRKELDSLNPAEIAAFDATFDQIMRESYSWDLWGAAYVVHGGASDDGFEYFRNWLISKGRPLYEAVLKDPDSLADKLAADSSGPLEFEGFAYVAREAWAARTGRDGSEMPGGAQPYGEPTGQPFEEDAAHLARRYPKLWKRFGNSPAQ